MQVIKDKLDEGFQRGIPINQLLQMYGGRRRRTKRRSSGRRSSGRRSSGRRSSGRRGNKRRSRRNKR